MIIEYQRPTTLEEALRLLARSEPATYPLGGGARLSRPSSSKYAVVDLQALGLNTIEPQGNLLSAGATVTLHQLETFPGLQPALVEAVRRETSINLRQTGTVAGALVSATGKSTLAAALLALDARLTWQPGDEEIGLGDYLPLRQNRKHGSLITRITFANSAALAFETVSRTPVDLPIVSAAVARWPGGRTRVVVGGLGTAPVVAMDGLEAGGAEEAAGNAYSHFPDLPTTEQDYINQTARVLVRRLIAAFSPA